MYNRLLSWGRSSAVERPALNRNVEGSNPSVLTKSSFKNIKMIKDSFNEVFGDKSKVLVVLGHPDDNEIICGGIVARLIAEGKKVRSISMTNGGKGFQDRTDTNEQEFGEIRKNEQ